jgi:hypothetical protein
VPNNLVLPSLEIRQFRALRELRIEQLGRANLIVGKNNVGKTSLLEALRLYAQPADPIVLRNLLEERDEISPGLGRRINSRDVLPIPFEQLFYGRQAIAGETLPIRIGPIRSEEKTLSISLEWYSVRVLVRAEPAEREEEASFSRRLGLVYRMGKGERRLPVSDASYLYRHLSSSSARSDGLGRNTVPQFFVGPNGLASGQLGKLWDTIALTNLEKDVIDGIRIIAPETERLILVETDEYSRSRMPVVKVKGIDRPISLRSMGDGVNRVFGIALALVNANDGILLVDEIENGIHYSVQPDLWRHIFQIARRLNVQVFATSHSWDCLEAFQKAADENKQEEGVLVRFDHAGDGVLARQLNERDLGIAVRGQIEIR